MSDPSKDIISQFVDDLVATVLDELGSNNVRSVFAGGSLARGEMSYCATDTGIDIYSDVDLHVVVTDNVDLASARHRVRSSAAEVRRVGDRYRFFRAPDVGVYTFADLAAQPARPGTVGLDVHHILLYGDPEVPALATEKIGSSIAVEESLYLLENRLMELAELQTERRRGGTAGGESGRAAEDYYTFTVCKTALDVVTAVLIARGEYTPGNRARWERLEVVEADPKWNRVPMVTARRCREALTRMPSPDWTRGLDAEATAADVVSMALSAWKRIAAEELGAKPDDWSAMILKRCRTGDYARNFRQFRAINTRCGFVQRGALVAGVHLSRYSPMDVLRLSAVLEYLSRDDEAELHNESLAQKISPYLERLTSECGFLQGSLAERATAMYRAAQ